MIVNGILVDTAWIAALISWLYYAWLLPDAFSMLFVYIAFLFMTPIPKQSLLNKYFKKINRNTLITLFYFILSKVLIKVN
jgi:hypothetical protein